MLRYIACAISFLPKAKGRIRMNDYVVSHILLYLREIEKVFHSDSIKFIKCHNVEQSSTAVHNRRDNLLNNIQCSCSRSVLLIRNLCELRIYK